MKKFWLTLATLTLSLSLTTSALAKPITPGDPGFSKTQDPEKMFEMFDEDALASNFKSLDTVFPFNIINPGDKKDELVTKKGPDISKITYNFVDGKHTVGELLDKTKTNAIMVLKKGKIMNEQYFNGYTAESNVTSWSVAKSFLSVLVGIAVDEGKIKSINDPVEKYVPSLKGSAYEGVPIKSVLEMSSGVKFTEDYTDPDSDVMQLIPYLVLDNGSVDAFTGTLKNEDPVGTHKYKSIDTQVIGMVVKGATGMPASQYLSEKIWKPLQMTSPAFWNKDLSGDEMSFAFLNAKVRDYAKFGQLMLDNGKYKGKQLVSEKWLKDSVTPSRNELLPGTADPYFGYGYQWWIPQGATYGEEFSAIGIYGQFIYVDKKDDVVIVKFSSDPMIIENDAETIEAFRAIAKNIK